MQHRKNATMQQKMQSNDNAESGEKLANSFAREDQACKPGSYACWYTDTSKL